MRGLGGGCSGGVRGAAFWVLVPRPMRRCRTSSHAQHAGSTGPEELPTTGTDWKAPVSMPMMPTMLRPSQIRFRYSLRVARAPVFKVVMVQLAVTLGGKW